MKIGHWTAAALVAGLLAGCRPPASDANRTTGDAGTVTGGVGTTDTTSMPDAGRAGMDTMARRDTGTIRDTARTGTDTSRP
ncbi:MAG TPA: hypothetical protein VFU46_11265 [Gemmatimonadales bacterium]|nr:hypothetical protein [Gemmatimonadales bacterium]